MVKNQHYFVEPVLKETYLRVRGFGADGRRTGGIISPAIVDLPAETILFRTYHDDRRMYGEWWFTPHEMSAIVEYFGRSGPAFAIGRQEGKGILHATMAVRHDWGGFSPDHLGKFVVVRLAEPLKAFHGEGDVAPNAAQTQVQKAVAIMDRSGRQRYGRQVFLPKPWEYTGMFAELLTGVTDSGLLSALTRYHRGPLYFEA